VKEYKERMEKTVVLGKMSNKPGLNPTGRKQMEDPVTTTKQQ
jgi:hypothetical protein